MKGEGKGGVWDRNQIKENKGRNGEEKYLGLIYNVPF
jgi:hypothetical protein